MGTFQALCKFKGCHIKKPINPAIKNPKVLSNIPRGNYVYNTTN